MRAIQIKNFGGPEALELVDIPQPIIQGDEVLIKVQYAGINYMDVYMRNGSYAKSHTYKTPLPMTLGMEGSGVVVALGKDVAGLAVGDRVAYCLSRGSYSEYAAVPAWRVIKVPDYVDSDQAAAVMLQGLTAHYLTHSIYPLKKDDWCLIHAGSGGVGQLAIQLAKIIGAKVITTVGSSEKADIARKNGADYVILYKESDFQKEVMQITNQHGVDVVYDSVGKDTIDRSICSIRKRGLCVMFGASSGQVPSITPLALAEAGSIYFTRPHLADYISTHNEILGRANDLFSLIHDKKLSLKIHKTFSLEEAKNAHQLLESRATLGKFLLKI